MTLHIYYFIPFPKNFKTQLFQKKFFLSTLLVQSIVLELEAEMNEFNTMFALKKII